MVRKGAGTGRRIVIAVPELGLQVQDQQVPSPENPDIGDIDDRTDFPFVVVFWRGSPGVFTRCRNPLFHESTYITVESLCVDEMHTMHLGVFASFVVHGLWALLSANVWNFSGSQEQMHARGAHVVAHELSQWYKREGRNNPGKPIYKLGGEFTLSVIGKQTAPVLHAKAAETGTLVAFVAWLCNEHRAKLEHGNAWVRAGDALLEYLAITRRAGPQLSPADRQGVMDSALRFLAVRERAGIPWIPKMHLMLHLGFQCEQFGNPLYVATWVDEGINRNLAAVCRSSHAAVWHRRVLATMNHWLSHDYAPKPSRKRPAEQA